MATGPGWESSMPMGGEEDYSANKACLSDYPSAPTESNNLKALLDPVSQFRTSKQHPRASPSSGLSDTISSIFPAHLSTVQ